MKPGFRSGWAALIIGLLLLTPFAACASAIQATSAPAHDCCPPPEQPGCEESICVCDGAAPGAVAPTLASDGAQASPLPIASEDASPLADAGSAGGGNPLAAPTHRYISNHQFRI